MGPAWFRCSTRTAKSPKEPSTQRRTAALFRRAARPATSLPLPHPHHDDHDHRSRFDDDAQLSTLPIVLAEALRSEEDTVKALIWDREPAHAREVAECQMLRVHFTNRYSQFMIVLPRPRSKRRARLPSSSLSAAVRTGSSARPR